MPAVIFDNLLEEINNTHPGRVAYASEGAGRAIRTRGECNERSWGFQIYNNASWGSRTVQAAPRRLGPRVRRFTVSAEHHPDLSVVFNRQVALSPERATGSATRLVTIRDTAGRAVVQLNSSAMYLLFDIEETQDPVALLRQLYEHFVCPLSEESATETPMRCYSGDVATPVAATTSLEAPAPAELPGRGERWEIHRQRNAVRRVPDVSRPEDAIQFLGQSRQRTLVSRLQRSESELDRRQRRYDELLRELHQARAQLWETEDETSALRAFQQNPNEDVDDSQTQALKAVLETYYEKIWVADQKIYGVTKPVVCSYREPEFDVDEQDHFQAVIGQFVVVAEVSGSVDYYRLDQRVARRNGEGEYHGPHKSGPRNICWGTYRDQLSMCQQNGDLAQLFMLVYSHLTSCTGNDCYIQLREYAGNLGLPNVDSADVDLNDPDTRERFLENAEAEMERIRQAEAERQRIAEEERLRREEEERQRLEAERQRQAEADRQRVDAERQESEVRMQRIAQISGGDDISLDELSRMSGNSSLIADVLTDNEVSTPEAPVGSEVVGQEYPEELEIQS